MKVRRKDAQSRSGWSSEIGACLFVVLKFVREMGVRMPPVNGRKVVINRPIS